MTEFSVTHPSRSSPDILRILIRRIFRIARVVGPSVQRGTHDDGSREGPTRDQRAARSYHQSATKHITLGIANVDQTKANLEPVRPSAG
eukprot:7108868-Pyramimonas_sp.AAC.1